jgi:hypothetical protein
MTTPDTATLVGLLAELDRVRALAIELLDRQAPPMAPEPPPDAPGAERASYELLAGARRAVLGHPAAARGLFDLLVAEGKRYARTPEGARLRDALVASEAVDHLRRVWETLTLNTLDGPVTPSGVPEAWAELLADVVAGQGLDAMLGRLRPGGIT